MKPGRLNRISVPRQRLAAVATTALMIALVMLSAGGPAASGATTSVRLHVVTSGDSPTTVDHYKYLISRDDAGNPAQPAAQCMSPAAGSTNASYPDGCDWPSIHPERGWHGRRSTRS